MAEPQWHGKNHTCILVQSQVDKVLWCALSQSLLRDPCRRFAAELSFGSGGTSARRGAIVEACTVLSPSLRFRELSFVQICYAFVYPCHALVPLSLPLPCFSIAEARSQLAALRSATRRLLIARVTRGDSAWCIILCRPKPIHTQLIPMRVHGIPKPKPCSGPQALQALPQRRSERYQFPYPAVYHGPAAATPAKLRKRGYAACPEIGFQSLSEVSELFFTSQRK